ncbi:MAG: nitrate/nitrite transporter NrtS [Vicinamibacterales bacterium]
MVDDPEGPETRFPTLREWCVRATNRETIRRALSTSVLVGPLLTVINHGGALSDDLSPGRILRVALTFVIPYVVSTVASVHATIGIASSPRNHLRHKSTQARTTTAPSVARAQPRRRCRRCGAAARGGRYGAQP